MISILRCCDDNNTKKGVSLAPSPSRSVYCLLSNHKSVFITNILCPYYLTTFLSISLDSTPALFLFPRLILGVLSNAFWKIQVYHIDCLPFIKLVITSSRNYNKFVRHVPRNKARSP